MGEKKTKGKSRKIINENLCVYFITDGDYVKIGVSADVRKRLSILQTANARKLEIVDLNYTKEAYELEKELHERFKHFKVNKEWYDILDMEYPEYKVKKEEEEQKRKEDLIKNETIFLTPDELAMVLKLSPKTIQKLIHLPDFPLVQGFGTKIPFRAFEEFLSTHRIIRFS